MRFALRDRIAFRYKIVFLLRCGVALIFAYAIRAFLHTGSLFVAFAYGCSLFAYSLLHTRLPFCIRGLLYEIGSLSDTGSFFFARMQMASSTVCKWRGEFSRMQMAWRVLPYARWRGEFFPYARWRGELFPYANGLASSPANATPEKGETPPVCKWRGEWFGIMCEYKTPVCVPGFFPGILHGRIKT